MSRVKKTLLNAKVNVLFYVLSVFVAFFTRKIFLDKLGVEFMGLVGTVGSILNFLNLAELGIGTAIGFALYKPLYDSDNKEINSVISLMGYLYKKIGLLLLIVGIILSFFFKSIFDESSFSLPLIYYCFYSFLTASLLGYYFNYHQTLLNADQRGYLINSYLQSTKLIKQLIQAYLAYYYGDIVIWITLELIFSITYSIIIRYKIKQIYPWLKFNKKYDSSENSEKYAVIIKKIKQIFVHKIATFVTFGTDQLLIFSLVNIKSVALFDNYNMIIINVNNLISQTFGNTNASVGNLVAENDKKNILKIFWELFGIRFFIAGFVFLNLYILVPPFIEIWLGSEYILSKTILFLILLNSFIVIVRSPIDNFINAYGLFADTWAPIAEMIINLSISLIFGKLWGISGIMLGTTISMLIIIMFWKTFYLFNQGFHISVLENFWFLFLKNVLAFVVSYFVITYILDNFISKTTLNYLDLVLLTIKLNLIIVFIFSPILFLFSEGFRNFVYRFKKYIPFL